MRVVMISTDKNIFDPASTVARRMVEYGETFGELHIVVFTLARMNFTEGSISDKVFVYPTNSLNRFSFVFNAIKIGKRILQAIYFGQTAITTQDPFETAFVGLVLRQKGKYPLQIQLHTDLYKKQFLDSSLVNWFRFQISKFTLPKADGIRVVRESIKENLYQKQNISKDKVTVLPIYVDIKKIQETDIVEDLHKKYPQWQSIVLMASRLSPEKNIQLALQAFKKVLEQGLNVGLVIVGEGSERKKLDDMCTQLLLDDNVAFEPWQPDLASYYKTADLFLNTSNFEGFGLTLLEASAAHCPVLTTNVGIAEDFFQDGINAFVCEIGDKECFINKMIEYFSNEQIRARVISAIAMDIERLSLTKQEYLDRQLNSLNVLFKNA